LLVQADRLTGVIDWGAAGLGDPSCDMIAAWGVLPPAARDSFRTAVGVDDATWKRGRGWAFSIGLIALPYYKDSNPEFAATARHLIAEVLSDFEVEGRRYGH
jgi:aminoglycoside phosphotransferase (APT) family kinase protein